MLLFYPEQQAQDGTHMSNKLVQVISSKTLNWDGKETCFHLLVLYDMLLHSSVEKPPSLSQIHQILTILDKNLRLFEENKLSRSSSSDPARGKSLRNSCQTVRKNYD